MTADWTDATLGDCVVLLSGGTPSKSHPEYWGGDLPWVSAKDMKSLRLFGAEDKLTVEGAANGTRVVEPNTVLMLVRGMTLHSNVPICITRRRMAFNQDVKALVAKPGVDPDFLAYALLSRKDQLLALVDSASHGTGRFHSHLLRSFPLRLPDMDGQKRIARVLSAIDDRMDDNAETIRLARDVIDAAFDVLSASATGRRRAVGGESPISAVDYGAPFEGEQFTKGEGASSHSHS